MMAEKANLAAVNLVKKRANAIVPAGYIGIDGDSNDQMV